MEAPFDGLLPEIMPSPYYPFESLTGMFFSPLEPKKQRSKKKTPDLRLSPFNQRKQGKKTEDGRDLITTLTLMTAVSRRFRLWNDLGRETKHAKNRTFIQENAYFISY